MLEQGNMDFDPELLFSEQDGTWKVVINKKYITIILSHSSSLIAERLSVRLIIVQALVGA